MIKKRNARLRIGVLGPHDCSREECELGKTVGRGIAERGAVLVCGGLDGMMEAAAEGAHSAGGLTIGILPGDAAGDANVYIDIPLPTGLGPFRNMLIARSCDAVIAISGRYGTLSEIAFALRLDVPVIGLHTWTLQRNGQIDEGIHPVETAQEAVALALKLATGKQ